MDPERFRAARANSEQGVKDNLSGLPPAPPHPYVPMRVKKNPKWPWITAVLVLLALIGLGAWAYKSYKNKPAKHNASSSAQSSGSAASIAPPQATPSIPSSSYSSTNFNTSFNYPTGWNVVDSGSAPLTVTSPVMTLVAANGQNVQGQAVLTLAKAGSLPTAFGTQSVAVLTSQKIAYNQPSTSQAAQSYLSFIQYPATTTVGGLDGIYMTGNFGYQKDQAIPSSDIASVNPLVYVSFYSCASSQCPLSSRQPLTISSSDWSSSSFSAPLLLMFKSFSFN
jgi:hypothetical protein